MYSKYILHMCQGEGGIELPKLSQFGSLSTKCIRLVFTLLVKMRLFLYLQKTSM